MMTNWNKKWFPLNAYTTTTTVAVTYSHNSNWNKKQMKEGK